MKAHLHRIQQARTLLKSSSAFLNLYYSVWQQEINVSLKDGPSVLLRSRGEMSISDPDIFDEVVLQDTYALKSMIRRGANVVDVGGHVGIFALWCAFNGAGRVVVVEPERENFEQLRRNVNNCKATSFKIINAAVWDSTTCYLSLDSRNSGGHRSTSKIAEVSGRSQKCSVIDLDHVLSVFSGDVIDILKIDCEGAESVILNDSVDLKMVKNLVIESHDERQSYSTKEFIVSFLTKRGFRVSELNRRSDFSGCFSTLHAVQERFTSSESRAS